MNIKNMIMDIPKKFNNFIDNIFSYNRTKEQNKTPAKIRNYVRPASLDWTNQDIANDALLRGIYNNSYPGMKLSGCFTKKPIDTPIQLMGLPIPKCNNIKIEEKLTEWINKNNKFFEENHRESHKIGTSWVWPKYSRAKNDIIIEFIPDISVLPPIIDIDTGEIIKIVTDEEIEIAYGEGDLFATVRRKRIFTKETIQIIWTQKNNLVANLVDQTFKNITGILPIPFTNKKDINQIRGNSDYSNIISDLKTYHDVYLQYSTALSKFTIKQIHTLSSNMDVSEWITNNGGFDPATVNIYERDLWVNKEGEKDEYIFPQGAFDSYSRFLELNYWKIVQGSDTPEIFWGLNAAGNHASVEDSHGQIVDYTKSKQNQHTDNYIILFTAMAKLYGIITMNNINNKITVEWNKLSSLDEKTKIGILNNFTTALATIINSASGTLDQVYKLWNEMYPQFTEDDFETWKESIKGTALHKSLTAASYEMISDMGNTDIDLDENEIDKKSKMIDNQNGEGVA